MLFQRHFDNKASNSSCFQIATGLTKLSWNNCGPFTVLIYTLVQHWCSWIIVIWCFYCSNPGEACWA